jgi:hypothetical protein
MRMPLFLLVPMVKVPQQHYVEYQEGEVKKLPALAVALFVLVGASPPAFPIDSTSGHPVTIFADPSDVVVVLDVTGACGGFFFNIRRSNLNFKELTAVVLTAFATGKRVQLFPSSCEGDRGIVDHGSVRVD